LQTHTDIGGAAYSYAYDNARQFSNRYFLYDAMNRQVVVDGVDAQGNLGTQGHRLAYDLNGNRKTDTYWGNKVAFDGGEIVGYDESGAPIYGVITGYDEAGNAIYTASPASYTPTQGYTTEEYGYDALNRMTSVVKDGVLGEFAFTSLLASEIECGNVCCQACRPSEAHGGASLPDCSDGVPPLKD
jgi:hypothetical protein